MHRLDKDTTGLLVVAKTDRAHQGLAEQFAAHGADGRLERGYRAIVWGAPERAARRRSMPRSPAAHANRTKIAVVAPTRAAGAPSPATRCWRPIRGDGRPQAGRQPAAARRSRPAAPTRCACTSPTSAIPLLGDMTYGAGFKASARKLGAEAQAALAALGRQALHAAELAFVHPVTGKRLALRERRCRADMAGWSPRCAPMQ